MPDDRRSELVSIVVPTLGAALPLTQLAVALRPLTFRDDLTIEVICVEAGRMDGPAQRVQQAGSAWRHRIIRTEERGHARVVAAGLAVAEGEILAVLPTGAADAELLPALVEGVLGGNDLVLSARLPAHAVRGRGLWRRGVDVATTLAIRPLTHVRDPLTACFALRRRVLEAAAELSPVGDAIALEILVRSRCERVREILVDVPPAGTPLRLDAQFALLRHLRRLYMFRYTGLASLVQFLGVGVSGTVVNLGVLTLLLAVAVPVRWALGSGIGVSIVTNFLLNRRFSFSYARHEPIARQFAGFVAASAIGAAVNFLIAIEIVARIPEIAPQLAAAVGIVGGMAFNFAINRYLVFRDDGASA